MIGNPKAVRLVTHTLHQVQGLAAALEPQWVGKAGAVDFLLALGKADNGKAAKQP